ncbi:MAG: hypothetical protein ACRD9Q_01235 [Nitrososphaeraceae archaeon]
MTVKNTKVTKCLHEEVKLYQVSPRKKYHACTKCGQVFITYLDTNFIKVLPA